MKAFTTVDGVEYQIRVNVGTVKRVLEETGLRLTDLFTDEGALGRFFSDDVKFAEVIYSVIRPQLEAAGKTAADFFEAIDGTVIEQAAEALLAEVVDFFQEPRKGLLKKVLAKWMEAKARMQSEGVAAVAEKIETLNFDEMMASPSSSPTPTNSVSSSPASAV